MPRLPSFRVVCLCERDGGEVRDFYCISVTVVRICGVFLFFFIALALIRKSHNQAFHKAGKLTSQPAAVLATDTYQEHLWKWPFMVSRRSCFTLWWVGRALFGRLRYLCYIKGFKVFHQRAACNLGLFFYEQLSYHWPFKCALCTVTLKWAVTHTEGDDSVIWVVTQKVQGWHTDQSTGWDGCR